MNSKKLFLLLSALLPALALWSQTVLQGTVTNSAGEALVGASVSIKGVAVGAITDIGGAFSLDIPPGTDQVLVVSYTGYGSREVAVRAGMRTIEITLEEGIILRETVVTALGITRSEKSLGYAVAQVEGSDLTKVRDANIVNQLAGRAAGVTVIGSSGNLGSSARITIRGLRSISGNNQPLFVVDGVPMDNSNFTHPWQAVGGYGALEDSQYDYGNAIQDLNPSDIENVSVLKGQAAAALYGSRGANGVIMISTKKGGKTGRGIGVTVNSSLTFEQVSVFPKFQNRYGGGVDLLPYGYADNSGYYKMPLVQYNDDGTVSTSWQSFDLVPVYGVDESNGVRFATSTDQHFQNLAGYTYENGQVQYGFPNGFGANQPSLYYRNWNSWDAWDTDNFGRSILWQAGDSPSDFFQAGVTSNQNISFDGGSDRSAFRLSYNRYDQKGLYPNSHQERNSLGFNGSLQMGKSLQATTGINYVNTRTLGRSATGYDARGGLNPAQNFNQWWHTQLRFDDLKQYQNPNGTQRTWNRRGPNDPNPQYWDNPYWTRYKNYQNDGRDRFFGNVALAWKLTDWLSLSGRVLQDYYSEFREERIAVGSLSPSKYSLDQYNVGETNTDLILRAERNLGETFSYSAFVGGNKLWRNTNRHRGVTRGGLNVPEIYTLQNSAERPFVQTTVSEKQIESVFGGLSVGWKSTLYLDLTGRQDWSSTLPEANNGYFYPSASLSYVFSEMVKIPAMSFGKLRLGWAKVGNDTDPYNIYTTYTPRDNFGNAPVFTVPNTLNNPGLLPEETSTIEAGLDLRFFKNRLGLDLSVYSGKTINQIIPLSTTPATGFDFQFINAGEISNKGIEIALNATPVQTQNFSWDIGFNFGKNVNEIVDLNAADPDLTALPITNLIFFASLVAQEGQPYGTIMGTNYLYDKNGSRLVDPGTGFYLVSGEVMPIGNITPDFTGGVTNTFRWKGLSLTAFFDFRKGGDIVSTTNMWGRYSGLFAETAVGDARENGVVNPGVTALVDGDGLPVLEDAGDPNTPLDDVYASTGAANTVAAPDQANRFFGGGYILNAADVYDGSFIKLRELSIAYTFPKRWLQRVRLQDFTVALVGRNLAILHKNIPNLDPDNAISTGNIQGSEGGQVPAVRSVGVNLSFRF